MQVEPEPCVLRQGSSTSTTLPNPIKHRVRRPLNLRGLGKARCAVGAQSVLASAWFAHLHNPAKPEKKRRVRRPLNLRGLDEPLRDRAGRDLPNLDWASLLKSRL